MDTPVHQCVDVVDDKYGKMLEFHTPASPFYKPAYAPRLGWKKLAQMLPHFEDGTVRLYLAKVCEEEGVELPPASLQPSSPPTLTPTDFAAVSGADEVAQAMTQAEEERLTEVSDDEVPF